MAYRVDVMAAVTARAAFAAALAAAMPAAAFDTTTHTAMTGAAFARSQLSQATLQERLGLLDYNKVFGLQYLDLGSTVTLRNRQDYEAITMAQVRKVGAPRIPADFTIAGWLMRGVIREDDNPHETPWSDEPVEGFSRVFGHFYDPVNNSGLNMIFGLTYVSFGSTAPDWALDSGGGVGATGFRRANHYKVGDATEAMWRALTLKAGDGSSVDPFGALSGESLRNAYWATSFRALGDVVHLIQDMAQPQHTRNDAHSGVACMTPSDADCLGGHDSVFEKYLKARTLRAISFQVNDAGVTDEYYIAARPLNYDGYLTPAFSTFREFFGLPGSDRASNRAAKGLANYSNRNFYTAGTLKWSQYPSPGPTDEGLVETIVDPPLDMVGKPLTGTKMTFTEGYAYDSIFDLNDRVKLYASSAWDQFLAAKGASVRGRVLNYYIYDRQADLLLPRAVAYSAGLIDFFYRGRLEVTLPPDGVYSAVDHSIEKGDQPGQGFRKVRAMVANKTGVVGGEFQTMEGGKLVAVAKYHRNTCYAPDLSGEWGAPEMVASKGDRVFDPPTQDGCRSAEEEIAVSQIASGVTLTAEPRLFEFTFSSKAIPLNATDLYLQVVYRGPIGREPDSIAVETLDVGEPNFVGYLNATDYLFCNDGTWVVLGANGEFPPNLLRDHPDWASKYAPVPLTDLRISFEANGPLSNPLATLDSLAPGKFARLAVLARLAGPFSDAISFPAERLITNGRNPAPDPQAYANQVYRTVSDVDAGTVVSSPKKRPVLNVRNFRMGAGLFYAYGVGATCGAPYPVSTTPFVPQAMALTLTGAWAPPQ